MNVGGAETEHGYVAVEMVGAPPLLPPVLIESLPSPSLTDPDDTIPAINDHITPLLAQQSSQPKVNIFSPALYSRRNPAKEQITRPAQTAQTETSPFLQITIWAWGGSRYSGLLCTALTAIIYCTIEVVSDVFTTQSIPLFEVAFSRCTIVLILSSLWVRKSRQPIFGPSSVRKLLALRAITGFISLLSFVYCIQRVPLSQAVILSFTAPIMASIGARIILHEKLKIAEIGGLACSFFGVLFIFRPMLTQGGSAGTGEPSNSNNKRSHQLYAVSAGLFSSIVGGVSYCFTRAGAKASDQPVLTVLSFGALASPASAILMFTCEEFVLPGFYTLLVMLLHGFLAFLAEITLARGLQLEKTSKVTNILYIQVVLSQFLGMISSRVVPTFVRLIGCCLILISACCTFYIGPEKEIE